MCCDLLSKNKAQKTAAHVQVGDKTCAKGCCCHALTTILLNGSSPEDAGEQAHVPGQQVQPEGRVNGGTSGEVCQLSTNLLCEQAEQALAAESAHWDVAGDGPAAAAQNRGWLPM